MIVVDENIHSREIMSSISGWYRGQVISVTQLRPRTVILDEAIPMLLHQLAQPTFVTTNVDDFWLKITAHSAYCFVCMYLPKERNKEIPIFLRELLSRPEFKTKALRMGKVVRISPRDLLYYDESREVKRA